MRRLVSVVALMSAVALVASSCSSPKDTGFPSETSSGTATGAPSPTGPAVSNEATIVAKDIQFDLKELTFAAGAPISLTLDNQDPGIPHNVSIYEGQTEIYKGELFQGEGKQTYEIPALKAGTYRFQCDVHPTMAGTVTVTAATKVPVAASSAEANEATIVAKNMQFDLKEFKFTADTPIELTLDNQDPGIPHNISIYDGQTEIYKGEIFQGVAKKTYEIPGLKAGTYRFQCDVHPTMEGTIIVA